MGVVLAFSWFHVLVNGISSYLFLYYNHAKHVGNITLKKLHGFDAHEN